MIRAVSGGTGRILTVLRMEQPLSLTLPAARILLDKPGPTNPPTHVGGYAAVGRIDWVNRATRKVSESRKDQ